MVQYAFITGASSGFGEAIAKSLSNEGYGLVLLARRADRLEALKRLLGKDNIHLLVADVRDKTGLDAAIQTLPDEVLQNISVLVNNAGLAAGRSAINEGSLLDWNQMIDTNIKGVLHVTQSVLPYMIRNQAGLIINITSIAGKEAYPQGNVYCATKAAVDQLTKTMRLDLLPHGIKVSSIAPGAAETEFSLVRFKGNVDQAASVYQGYLPLLAKDIAETVLFIVSRPSHVSIHDLVIMPSAQASATLFKKD